MRYRGAVNYYVNLPSNPTQGDVWVVRYQGVSGTIPNGHAYCWEDAPVSSDRTYIGSVPAYGEIINHYPEIVTWLKDKEDRGLTWAAFTIGYGIFFITPSSPAKSGTTDLNYGRFLFPIIEKIDNYIYLRKSDIGPSGTGSNFNTERYALNWRHYDGYNDREMYRIGQASQLSYSRIGNHYSQYDVIINSITYKAYRIDGTSSTGGVSKSSAPITNQSAICYMGSSADLGGDYLFDFDSRQEIPTPTNFVSNRLLFNVRGELVEPDEDTYVYGYASIDNQLQWVDLGNLAETLPTDKGCIYYNGICYSAGGFNMDKYMLRQDPTGEGNFYFNTSLSEITHGNIADTNLFTNNIFNSRNIPISVGTSGTTQSEITNNIISISKSSNNSATFSVSRAGSNIVVGEDLVISVPTFDWNAVFGIGHTIAGLSLFDYNTVGGSGHTLVPNGESQWMEYNTVFGESNRLIGASYANVALGYGNQITCGSSGVDAEAIAIGKQNIIQSGGNNCNIAIGYNNILPASEGSRYSRVAFGDSNTVTGYYLSAFGKGNVAADSSYSGVFGDSCTLANCYECWDIGYYSRLLGSGYSVLLGVSSQSSDCYEIANVGYENRILASGYGYGIGTSNTMAGAYECGISGYYNAVETTIENPQGYSGHNYGVYYSHVLGVYNRAKDTSGAWLFGYSNQSTGDQYMTLIGFNNISESYATGTSYGRTNYRTNNCGALMGYYNQVHASENGSCNYPYIFGANNHINSNLQYVYHTYIIGEGNNSTDSTNDTYIIGDFNTTNNTKNVYLLGSHITITNTNNAIRLGFVPLINDDFFAIGDGTRVYNESTYEWDETPHSIIRIDSSKNIYLNSTIPTPPILTINGSYRLKVLSGVSSWENDNVPNAPLTDGAYHLSVDSGIPTWAEGGGSDVPELPTTPGAYILIVEDNTIPDDRVTESGDVRITEEGDNRTSEVTTTTLDYSWSALPALPTSDGDYKLHIASGVATWVAIS